MIGKGCFGTRSKIIFKDMYTIYVKVITDSLSLNSIKAEAKILCFLNDGEHTPHYFGVYLEKRAIVSLYVCLMHHRHFICILKEFHPKQQFFSDSIVSFLLQIGEDLKFVHQIHSDLKCDNVTLSHTMSYSLKVYIIDFCKACMVCNAKHYKLSAAELQVYKLEYTQIAPDLRDGIVSQCTATDVYSFGGIIISCMHIHHDDLN